MSAPRKPRPKQLSYLRGLADSRGVTFAYPKTIEEASAEIDRLKAMPPQSRRDRVIEHAEGERHVRRAQFDATAIRPGEVDGYGAEAHWSAGSSGSER